MELKASGENMSQTLELSLNLYVSSFNRCLVISTGRPRSVSRYHQPGSIRKCWNHDSDCDLRPYLSSVDRSDVGLVSWSILFISQFEGHVKEPTLLFKKGRGSFLNGLVGGRIAQIIHVMSLVGYGKLINGLITETSGTVVCWRLS